ncbi:MAG: hypothetical protein LBP55_01700 [Candidatus Adiutrix sp.]|jgi:hypothetical protein|nr:hypothetical protein [Candidatus Adiutrix sp.]
MSSVSQSDKLAARVAVKVPQPDSLVEVRLTPPESNFEIKVSPGDDVIELRISPGSSLIEVRISPPGHQVALDADEPPALSDEEKPEEEVVAGVSRSEFAAMVADEEAAEAKKLLSDLGDQEPTSGLAEPETVEPELIEPELIEPEEPEPAEETEPPPPVVEPVTEATIAEPEDELDEEKAEPEPEPEPEPEEKVKNGASGLIGQAAREALDRLSAAVQEEQAAALAATKDSKDSEPEAKADLKADATVMVEIYDDGEASTAADTVTPLPDDELMDISQMEQDEDLAIENIDVAGLSDIDLDKSRLAVDHSDGQSAIKAKPLTQARPGHTIVPE